MEGNRLFGLGDGMEPPYIYKQALGCLIQPNFEYFEFICSCPRAGELEKWYSQARLTYDN